MPSIFETPQSGDFNGDPVSPQFDREYTALDYPSEQAVYVAAKFLIPPAIATPSGILYHNDKIRVKTVGYGIYSINVSYTKFDMGAIDVEWDTTGGTVRVRQSQRTVGAWKAGGDVNDGLPPNDPAWPNPGGAPDHKGLIGVHGDDVDGAEKIIPALKLTVTFKHPVAFVSMSYIKNLASWVGRTNDDMFLEFAPGELLYMGTRGRLSTNSETSVAYEFAASENFLRDIGDFVQVFKSGHDILWSDDHPVDNKGEGVRQPRWLYVENLYDSLDFAGAFGFGGS